MYRYDGCINNHRTELNAYQLPESCFKIDIEVYLNVNISPGDAVIMSNGVLRFA